MEPQTTILVILALCITLLVLIFAVGYSAGIAHAQKAKSMPPAMKNSRAAAEKNQGAPIEFYPTPRR